MDFDTINMMKFATNLDSYRLKHSLLEYVFSFLPTTPVVESPAIFNLPKYTLPETKFNQDSDYVTPPSLLRNPDRFTPNLFK